MGVHDLREEVPPVSEENKPTSAQLIAEQELRRNILFWLNIIMSAWNAVQYHYTGERPAFFFAVLGFFCAWVYL